MLVTGFRMNQKEREMLNELKRRGDILDYAEGVHKGLILLAQKHGVAGDFGLPEATA